MTELRRAELIALEGDERGTPKSGFKPVVVQFNPASLRLQLTNQSEGGRSRGRQAEQHLGKGATTLSFDLHFDTADTGENVQVLTKQVEQFVLPMDQRGKQAPPRVRFHWGDLIFDGLMSGITEDIDYFSPAGVPLRAKLSVSLKGQDPEFAARKSGPGANTGASAKRPGGTASLPGTSGLPPSLADRTGVALGGESAASFAARMGLDPSAWRGLSAGLEASLSLPAGLEIDFSSGLTASAGIAVSAGVDAGASASVDSRFGLAGDGPSAGFLLSAAGGVRAAVDAVQAAKAKVAATEARAAFTTPQEPTRALRPTALASGGPAVAPAPPQQPRPRLAGRGLPPRGEAPPPAPIPPPADPRATTFGFGAPLRERIAGAALERGGAYAARTVVERRTRPTDLPPAPRDPTQPRWTALPARRTAAQDAESPYADRLECGCGGGKR